ncbi:uncharacterized protein BDZ99DRAFT_470757 [Mytilinidion resinicola]|uniref:Uncharacterized protein n=1 Tax=Mytilinidion resinicola TaxID=574789 RepID=A0A6A6ZBW2_9PEZI|nr:uncharacterized protein BDZ99DRAFT_470757 [Mytilinidion resinicola]KAF2817804.1 hypothetical protein BDZ99DRAFT_470757 [Mytilinidion resinicola]
MAVKSRTTYFNDPRLLDITLRLQGKHGQMDFHAHKINLSLENLAGSRPKSSRRTGLYPLSHLFRERTSLLPPLHLVGIVKTAEKYGVAPLQLQAVQAFETAASALLNTIKDAKESDWESCDNMRRFWSLVHDAYKSKMGRTQSLSAAVRSQSLRDGYILPGLRSESVGADMGLSWSASIRRDEGHAEVLILPGKLFS